MPKLQQEPGQVGSIKEPYVRLVVSETVLQEAHGEFNVRDTSTRPRIIACLVFACDLRCFYGPSRRNIADIREAFVKCNLHFFFWLLNARNNKKNTLHTWHNLSFRVSAHEVNQMQPNLSDFRGLENSEKDIL